MKNIVKDCVLTNILRQRKWCWCNFLLYENSLDIAQNYIQISRFINQFIFLTWQFYFLSYVLTRQHAPLNFHLSFYNEIEKSYFVFDPKKFWLCESRSLCILYGFELSCVVCVCAQFIFYIIYSKLLVTFVALVFTARGFLLLEV